MALMSHGRRVAILLARSIPKQQIVLTKSLSYKPSIKLVPKLGTPKIAPSQRFMFIQTQETPNPQSLKFLPGAKVGSSS